MSAVQIRVYTHILQNHSNNKGVPVKVPLKTRYSMLSLKGEERPETLNCTLSRKRSIRNKCEPALESLRKGRARNSTGNTGEEPVRASGGKTWEKPAPDIGAQLVEEIPLRDLVELSAGSEGWESKDVKVSRI